MMLGLAAAATTAIRAAIVAPTLSAQLAYRSWAGVDS